MSAFKPAVLYRWMISTMMKKTYKMLYFLCGQTEAKETLSYSLSFFPPDSPATAPTATDGCSRLALLDR